jgi:hypothetical protein
MADFYAVILDRDRDDKAHVAVIVEASYEVLRKKTTFAGPTRVFSRERYGRYHCSKGTWIEAKSKASCAGSIFKLKGL